MNFKRFTSVGEVRMDNLKDVLKGGMDTKTNKALFSFFLALMLVLVGARLWSDARYRSVPVPSQLAVSADGVAVVCGHTVYLYSTNGTAIRTYALPGSAKPTQLFWDRGSLRVADMESKGILVLDAGSITERNFTGPAINAQFKVAREPGTGDLFVSDEVNQRILVFDQSYRYVRRFGRMGDAPGELWFPTSMSFDGPGRLLIANTKRTAIDVFRPDGRYLSTLVNSAGDGDYCYPTDFIATPHRLVVLENDWNMERGRVRVYDRKGEKLGELDAGGSRVIGDIAAYGDTIYLTDVENRQLKTFSLANLQPLGTFSREFDRKCSEWRREAGLYKRMSRGSLIVLLLVCAPIIVFYLKIKKEETEE
jgi:DNA-binding beta-propeller fold protein YncE